MAGSIAVNVAYAASVSRQRMAVFNQDSNLFEYARQFGARLECLIAQVYQDAKHQMSSGSLSALS